MSQIEEHIKTIALRIQEAVRHLAPVVFEEAVPVALALVEKHGVNNVWTVDQLKAAGALELESLVKKTLNPTPTTPKPKDPADDGKKNTPPADKTKTEGNEGQNGGQTEGGGDPTGSPE